MKYQFVAAHKAEHCLTRLCPALGVGRSGYYAWRRRPASARARANECLVEQMRQAPSADEERYGAVKLRRALVASGVACGRHRTARLRRVHGLEARRI